MVLRPSPTKPTNARKRSVHPVDTPMDLSKTMSCWVQHKITESEIDADINEKRHELEQSRFQHEMERQHKTDTEVEKRAQAELERDEKRFKLEGQRLEHEIDVRKDELALQRKADAGVEKRAQAELQRDEKRFELEGQRLEHEREVRKDELALRQRELVLREECEKNRSSEAKELAKMTYENQKQTTDASNMTCHRSTGHIKCGTPITVSDRCVKTLQ
eukprot:jgi/Undpi1/1151/HiC_scaffold_10.g04613.m1